VVEEVLCADTERLRLVGEETELLTQLECNETPSEELARLCDRLATVGAELEASGAEGAEAQVRQILVGLQFTEKMMDGSVKLLSGGWRMRVSLAKALFLAPDLLLLDEPTNHLDLDAVIWLDEFLSNEFKKTLLVVSHDADFLDSVCTDIVHLEDQKLWQYRGGYTMFKKMHAQRKRENEKEFKKLLTEGNKAGSKSKKPDKEELDRIRPLKQYTVRFNFLPCHPGKEECGISVNDVNFSYSGRKPWLLGPELNFRIDPSMRIAVVGPNGAGKSTLLNLLTKTAWPCDGDVDHSRKLTIGRYSQHFEELNAKDALSPVELLTDPEIRRFGGGIENKEQAHKSLGQFGLPSHAHTRPLRELSGGQKARVQFAMLTCRRPEILILDEPTNHLDIESVEEIIAALGRYEGGFVLVSHDARLITATQAQLWLVDGSGVVKPGGEGRQGFEAYRRSVLREMERRREREAEKAQRRMDERRRRREKALSDRRKK
jgi:ATP-binding cassette subfamily F protein 1